MNDRGRFDSRYGFAVGRIRVLEKRMLTRSVLDRLIASSTPDEGVRILSETGFADIPAAVRTWGELERKLSGLWAGVLDLLDELTLDPPWTDLFRKRIDYHNLKVFFKASRSGSTHEGAVMQGGLVPLPLLQETAQGRFPDGLPDFARRAGQAVLKVWKPESSPDVLDRSLDREQAMEWETVLQDRPNRFLQDWHRLEMDLHNMDVFFRVKAAGWGKSLFRESLLPGGTLDTSGWEPLLDGTWENAAAVFVRTSYGNGIGQAMVSLKESGRFEAWVDQCLEYRWHDLQPFRRFFFGPEVLLAFGLSRQLELSLIGRVLVGKAAGMDAESIGRRIPRVF